MAVISHLVDESSIAIGSDGIEATDVYLVTKLGGPAGARLYQATLQGGIPRHGDAHPFISGIQADNITCRAVDGEAQTFRIVVVSRRPVIDSVDSPDNDEIDSEDYGSLRFFYVTREEKTELDKDGNQIILEHTFAPDDAHGRGGATYRQGGEVSIQTWQQGFTFSRRESRSPAPLQAQYGGLLNRTRWNGYDARSVMCVGIDGETRDGGLTWTVNYNFMLDTARKWRKDALFTDTEEGGRPPPDLILGNGVKTVDIYPDIDFAPLAVNISRLRRGRGLPGATPLGYPLWG